jgi:hypothetical protein
VASPPGTVSIDPAPSRGVLPLPFSALKAAFPVLGNPANRKKAVTLTFDQFRYGFANAVSEDEAHRLYDEFHVAAPGRPLFQAATANLDPRTVVRADKANPQRGPMLVVTGEKDNIVPFALANAAYKQQRKNSSPTEIVEIPGRRPLAGDRQPLGRGGRRGARLPRQAGALRLSAARGVQDRDPAASDGDRVPDLRDGQPHGLGRLVPVVREQLDAHRGGRLARCEDDRRVEAHEVLVRRGGDAAGRDLHHDRRELGADSRTTVKPSRCPRSARSRSPG